MFDFAVVQLEDPAHQHVGSWKIGTLGLYFFKAELFLVEKVIQNFVMSSGQALTIVLLYFLKKVFSIENLSNGLVVVSSVEDDA